ncbi:HtaA domain-containing protein [Nocardioides sp. YIM 152588]|uniref:HtaA domain-containing protein n=1 Tax=Nocardioides sp. YIM 152588 TaxID=3158259 RepID=UPI0032E37CA2
MGPGLLEWGVKESFRRYVAALPDGCCDVSSEIALPGGGRYGFPLIEVEAAPAAVLRFIGGVLFRGHGGLLHVPLVEPWLHRHGDRWVMTVAVGTGPDKRAEIAAGAVSAAGDGEVLLDLRVSGVGSSVFGGNYPVGTELDRARLRLAPTTAEELADTFIPADATSTTS